MRATEIESTLNLWKRTCQLWKSPLKVLKKSPNTLTMWLFLKSKTFLQKNLGAFPYPNFHDSLGHKNFAFVLIAAKVRFAPLERSVICTKIVKQTEYFFRYQQGMLFNLEEDEKISKRDCTLAYINSAPVTTRIGTVKQEGSFVPNYPFSAASKRFWNKRVTEKEVRSLFWQKKLHEN